MNSRSWSPSTNEKDQGNERGYSLSRSETGSFCRASKARVLLVATTDQDVRLARGRLLLVRRERGPKTGPT